MRNTLILILGLVLLNGCATTPDDAGLKTRVASNPVAETNLNLGIAYMQRGEFDKALEKLDRAYTADPKYYATHFAYGLLYQQLGKPKEADEHFRKALSLNPTDSATRNAYGQFQCLQGHYKKAINLFKEAANNPLYQTPEVPLSNAGLCAVQNKDDAKAESYFRHALEINPKIPLALLQMCRLSYIQGKFLSARGYLQRFQEVARHTPESLWLGIRIERELGDKNAVASYGLLLKNNYPDSEETALYLESRQR